MKLNFDKFNSRMYDGQTEEEFLKELISLLETIHDNIVYDDYSDTTISDIRADSTQFVLLKTLKYLYYQYYGLEKHNKDLERSILQQEQFNQHKQLMDEIKNKI